MNKRRWIATAFYTLFTWASCVCAQSLPTTAGETIAGKPLVLARAVANKPAMIVIGFTKDSSAQTAAWAKAIRADQLSKDFALYQVAMLEAVPSLLRGVVKGSIRKGVPIAQQDTFVVLFHDEIQWKHLVSYSKPDDAYVLVLDSHGVLVAVVEGNSNEHYSTLTAAMGRAVHRE